MKTKQQLLSELFLTCIELNDDDFTVFCDCHGHIKTIQIRVCEYGYNKSNDWGFEFEIYTNEHFNDEECQRIIYQLPKIKDDATKQRKQLAENEELRKEKRKQELIRELEELSKS